MILFLSISVSVWMSCRTYLIDRITIRGHSMDPTLHEGEKVWVNEMAKYVRKIGRNDLVVLVRYPSTGTQMAKSALCCEKRA